VLDSNVYDQLVETPERQLRFVGAHDRGLIELLMTHIQRDELSQIPDAARRNAILAIPFVITPTYGIVLGTSRLGMARFGDPERIDAIRSPTGEHTNDALIATTAEYEGAVLVTEERRLTNRARAQGIEVWSAGQLIRFVESL
jgi:predicted nucleic acid-binding protein